MAPSFTIAIPTHDRRETLLLAVRSALAQTHPPEQVLVLCDGCSDGTPEALRALGDERVEVLELPKLPGYAYGHRNRALELARCELISWLSDDDLLLPDHLERVGEYWDGGRAELVQAPTVAVGKDDSLTWIGLDWGMPKHLRTMLEVNTNAMSAVSVRVADALAAGGWDKELSFGGDWDLWKRMIAAGARPAMSSEPTVLHFRADGRAQPWPARVRQNSEWAERIADPAALADLRLEMRALRSAREADWAHALDSLENEAEHSRAEIERLREAEMTLARVYGGGWWRLRGRLLALPLAAPLHGLLGRRASHGRRHADAPLAPAQPEVSHRAGARG